MLPEQAAPRAVQVPASAADDYLEMTLSVSLKYYH